MKMHKYVCKIYISAWVFCTWSIILQWPLVVIRGETSLSQYQRLMKRLFFAAHFVKWVTPTALLFKQRAEAYVTPQQSRWPWWRWACCSHPTDSHQNLSQVHRPLPSRSVNPCSHTNHHHPSFINMPQGQSTTWRRVFPVQSEVINNDAGGNENSVIGFVSTGRSKVRSLSGLIHCVLIMVIMPLKGKTSSSCLHWRHK